MSDKFHLVICFYRTIYWFGWTFNADLIISKVDIKMILLNPWFDLTIIIWYACTSFRKILSLFDGKLYAYHGLCILSSLLIEFWCLHPTFTYSKFKVNQSQTCSKANSVSISTPESMRRSRSGEVFDLCASASAKREVLLCFYRSKEISFQVGW